MTLESIRPRPTNEEMALIGILGAVAAICATICICYYHHSQSEIETTKAKEARRSDEAASKASVVEAMVKYGKSPDDIAKVLELWGGGEPLTQEETVALLKKLKETKWDATDIEKLSRVLKR